ncbi:MAG: ERF family protein [Desulfovibrionaceae bacterium]|nr:ERF family protein [Desulfovibrionaceae bacterium]
MFENPLRLQSESIDQLAVALAAAQSQMEPAGKNAEAPVTKDGRNVRRYADLAAVFDVLRKTLPEQGLAVTQTLLPREDGKVHVRTMLLHKSGQWIAGECIMPCDRQGGIQGMGSAITYARRYSLSALVGVVSEEDDDGVGAQGDGRDRRPPINSASRQGRSPEQSDRRPPAPHISLEEAQWEFATCNSPEALQSRARELRIREDNPRHADIQAAYKARLSELREMDGPSQDAAGSTDEQRLTPNQRTAIMSHYGRRGMTDEAHRAARLKDLSDFCGRPINSVNDLSAAEAADFISAINRTGAQNMEAA